MNVHCCLPSVALAQVERAVPPPSRVSNSPDWNVVVERLGDPSCDVVVVDPTLGSDRFARDRIAALDAAFVRGSSCPIVGFVAITAAAIKAAHALARLGASEIVVRGLDDGAAALRSTLQRVVADSAAARLMSGSSSLLSDLPPGIAQAVAALFRRPEDMRSIADLAASARTTRRTLDRQLARVGLAPARTLLACARAHAAYRLLAAGSVRPSGAALLVGYPSPRALTREFRALTGHVPSAVPSRLPSDRFLAMLSGHLARASRAAGRGAEAVRNH